MGILQGSVNVSFIKWHKLYSWIRTKLRVNSMTYIFRSILPWVKLWISYFYWQEATCASGCKVTCLWSEALVTVRMAEPQHMKTTLTRSIGERVSEVSSGSFRLRVSAGPRHSWNFIKCAYFGFGNTKKRKTINFRKHTWEYLIYYV